MPSFLAPLVWALWTAFSMQECTPVDCTTLPDAGEGMPRVIERQFVNKDACEARKAYLAPIVTQVYEDSIARLREANPDQYSVLRTWYWCAPAWEEEGEEQADQETQP